MVLKQLTSISVAERGLAFANFAVIFCCQLCTVTLFDNPMKVSQKDSFRESIVLEGPRSHPLSEARRLR